MASPVPKRGVSTSRRYESFTYPLKVIGDSFASILSLLQSEIYASTVSPKALLPDKATIASGPTGID